MKRSVTTAAAILAALAVHPAHADEMADAKARVAKATEKAGQWDGPTTGPKIAPGKTIIYLAGDMRNGGTEGVSRGVEEAAKAAGWTLRILDGRGEISARTAALNQAVALKPDGVVVGGFDALEQNASLATLKEAGIPFVGWHATIDPGPDAKTGMFANVNTRIADVAQTAADLAIVNSGGKAGVVIFGDSNYEMAIGKARMMEAAIKKCPGCTVLTLEDSPMTEASTRMPQLTTSLLQRYGDKWTYSLAVNDLYYDFMGPSLSAAGKAGTDTPYNISAGDGSESAFQRIRAKQNQIATVPEPLQQQGWQLVDELNRAFAKQPWSGYVSGIHLVTADNVAFDGGPKNIFDPDNGYRDHYKQIWGK
ncbi:substrate-binding domain-containing protein [Lichenihabitans sp. Uapishka_5]|uniref:substrate-binding domain-containing protein n=1 Tax=Lichenihabitans sp. Uapishka_5 TaxID=3037302 RepID=UPI0029E7E345|nr:substrate-binding domain-containing protein [Lichenihabitans sp. Uapishka_5]MDX7953023.1 substrate-binding domain-containing protein [Lichenihabitans sp. Uapishka_5]